MYTVLCILYAYYFAYCISLQTKTLIREYLDTSDCVSCSLHSFFRPRQRQRLRERRRRRLLQWSDCGLCQMQPELDGRRALPPPLPPPLLQWVAVLSAQSLPRRPAPQPGQLPADLGLAPTRQPFGHSPGLRLRQSQRRLIPQRPQQR